MSSEEKAYSKGYEDRLDWVLEPRPSLTYDAPSYEYTAYVMGYMDASRGHAHIYQGFGVQEEMFA